MIESDEDGLVAERRGGEGGGGRRGGAALASSWVQRGSYRDLEETTSPNESRKLGARMGAPHTKHTQKVAPQGSSPKTSVAYLS